MKNYPPPSYLCPIFDYVNKWNFLPPPSQIGKCLIQGNIFFEGIPYFPSLFYQQNYKANASKDARSKLDKDKHYSKWYCSNIRSQIHRSEL